MEADDVFSQLSDKISSINDKLSEFQGTIDYLQSTLTDQKSAIDKTQSDIERINDALKDVKSGGDSKPDDTAPKVQELQAEYLRIEAANAAADKKAAEQAGLIGKLAAQAEDAAKTLVNFPDTIKAIANKAVDDSKKEILNIWDSSKKDILDSASKYATDYIKEQKTAIKGEIKDELKSLIFDDIDEVAQSKPKPVLSDELEGKVNDILAQSLESKVKAIVAQIEEDQGWRDKGLLK